MSTKTLIILLGNKNDSSGRLSPISILRCRIATAKFNSSLNAAILPTGGYGTSFNKTGLPHYLYLQKFLNELGVPQSKILRGTDTSGTYQDLLVARKEVKKYDKIYIVTLNYHKERVEYICNKIFGRFNYEVITENQYPSLALSDITLESIKLEAVEEINKFKTEVEGWIDIPLDDRSFPVALYENAASEHKHFDTVSIALISGVLISTFSLFQVERNVILFSLVIIAVNTILHYMYLRAAKSAREARRTMIFLELAYSKPGFSVNHENKIPRIKKNRIRTFGFRELTRIIFIGSILIALYQLFQSLIKFIFKI